MITKMGSSHPECQTIRLAPAGDGENWGHSKQITKSVSPFAAVGSPEDQAGKWFAVSFCRRSNYTCSRASEPVASWHRGDDVTLCAHRLSFTLTQERRSSCHFECQVWAQMKIFVDENSVFFLKFYILSPHQSFLHLTTIFWLVQVMYHLELRL